MENITSLDHHVAKRPKDPQILAALIGGISTIIASIIGVVLAIVLSRNSPQSSIANRDSTQNAGSPTAREGRPSRIPNASPGSERPKAADKLEGTVPSEHRPSTTPPSAPQHVKAPSSAPKDDVGSGNIVPPQSQPQPDYSKGARSETHSLHSGQSLTIPSREISITAQFQTSMDIEYVDLNISGRSGILLRKPIMNSGSQFDFVADKKTQSISITSIDWQNKTVAISISDKPLGGN